MNDQFNPVGTDQTEIATKENGRRRLVRGAVALAPLVLTLRSGALAAASCTGLKATANTRPSTANRPGRIVNATPTAPVVGDVCVLPDQLTACDDPSGTKVLTSSNLTPVNSEPVALYTNPNLPLNDNNPYLVCGSSSGPNAGFIGQRNIAILSAQSASSMVIASR
jgi:hypothetical protein